MTGNIQILKHQLSSRYTEKLKKIEKQKGIKFLSIDELKRKIENA